MQKKKGLGRFSGIEGVNVSLQEGVNVSLQEGGDFDTVPVVDTDEVSGDIELNFGNEVRCESGYNEENDSQEKRILFQAEKNLFKREVSSF